MSSTLNTPPTHLALSGDSATPVYQQIKEAIRAKTQTQEWSAGMLIPSEHQLVASLNASRMTINRALRELTAEGLLRRVHGLGTFVAEPPRHAHLVKLVSIADEIKQQGKQHSSQLLSLEQVPANADLCERMQLPDGAQVYRAVLVHKQDDVPIQIEVRAVNPALVPDFMQVDFSQTTPAEHLIKSLRPDELEHIVQAIMPTAFMAKHLDIPASEPCLKLRRRTWKNQQVVTAVDLIYPSSRYQLGARYTPSAEPPTESV